MCCNGHLILLIYWMLSEPGLRIGSFDNYPRVASMPGQWVRPHLVYDIVGIWLVYGGQLHVGEPVQQYHHSPQLLHHMSDIQGPYNVSTVHCPGKFLMSVLDNTMQCNAMQSVVHRETTVMLSSCGGVGSMTDPCPD